MRTQGYSTIADENFIKQLERELVESMVKVYTPEEIDAMDGDELNAIPLVLVYCNDGEIRNIENVEVIYGVRWQIVGFEPNQREEPATLD